MSRKRDRVPTALMFSGITALVAVPVLIGIFVLTFLAAATWGSTPTGAMKVLVNVWKVLVFPGTLLHPLVGDYVYMAAAMVWGLVVASVHLIVRKALQPREQPEACQTCNATGWILSGSLSIVCPACHDRRIQSPPNKSLERTREG